MRRITIALVLVSAAFAAAPGSAAAQASCGITYDPATFPAAHIPLPDGYVGVLYDMRSSLSGGNPGPNGYTWQNATAQNQYPPGVAHFVATTAVANDTLRWLGTPTQRWGPVGFLGDFTTSPGNCANAYSYTLRIDGPPSVSGFTPSSGPAGTDVHVSGQDLAPGDVTAAFAGGAA